MSRIPKSKLLNQKVLRKDISNISETFYSFLRDVFLSFVVAFFLFFLDKPTKCHCLSTQEPNDRPGNRTALKQIFSHLHLVI